MNISATTASFGLSIVNSAVQSVAVSTNPPATLIFLLPENIPPTAAAGARAAARKALSPVATAQPSADDAAHIAPAPLPYFMAQHNASPDAKIIPILNIPML